MALETLSLTLLSTVEGLSIEQKDAIQADHVNGERDSVFCPLSRLRVRNDEQDVDMVC